LRAPAHRNSILVQHENPVGFPDAVKDDFVVHRKDGAQVDDLEIEFIRQFNRGINSRAPRDDGGRISRPLDFALAEWNQIIRVRLARYCGDMAVKPLVLEKEHGIVRAGGVLDQALRIFGVAWENDVPAWCVRIDGFNALGMKRTAFDSATAGNADNHRIRPRSIAAPAER